jgi:group I intron endonuclease
MYGVIYKVSNTANGRFYIGQTKTRLSSRWSKHKQDARRGRGWLLAAAIRKYGVEAFCVTVVEQHASKDALNAAEIKLIAELKPEYNACAGGGGLGSPTAEVREKISRAIKGRVRSLETRARMSNAQKGHAVSKETILKIQAALTPRHEALRRARVEKYGTTKRVRPPRVYTSPLEEMYKKVGATTKQEKISLAAKQAYQTGSRRKLIGADNPMYGKTKSPELRQMLSRANKGEANAFYGQTHSEATRAKMREAHALRPLITCPHCGQSGKANAMKRWHFDNCKVK